MSVFRIIAPAPQRPQIHIEDKLLSSVGASQSENEIEGRRSWRNERPSAKRVLSVQVAERLKISCLLIMLPLLRGTAAAQDPALEKIVAEESAIELQTDPKVGPGWPDVSKSAEDRRTAALKALQVRLAALPPSPAGSEDALTQRLLEWRLGMRVEAARFDEARIPFDNGARTSAGVQDWRVTVSR